MKLPPRVEGHLALVDRAVGSLLRGWARALPEVLVFTLVIFLCGSLLFTTATFFSTTSLRSWSGGPRRARRPAEPRPLVA